MYKHVYLLDQAIRRLGVSVHLACERASCAADWRLFCPQSWDDKAPDDPVAAARARRRRKQARIPGDIRHREKWRLALEMIDEMAGPGGWGVLEQVTAAGGDRPVVTADAGYGDSTAFRLELGKRGWRYVVAVNGATSAHAAGAPPAARSLGRRPRPPAEASLPRTGCEPAYPGHRTRGPDLPRDLEAGHQDHQRQPRRADDQLFPGDPGPPRQPGHPPRR
jgi:SRSO17 transposase